MIVYTGRYTFRNPDGRMVEFGPGDWMRRWTSGFGVAHDFLADYDSQAFHSPGPGGRFSFTRLPEVLRTARWLQVVDGAPEPIVAWSRIQNAISIIGTPWTFQDSNCQDTVSAVVTGRPQSFQRDALYGLGIVLVAGALFWPSGKRSGSCLWARRKLCGA